MRRAWATTTRRWCAAAGVAIIAAVAPATAAADSGPPTDYTNVAGLSQPVHETVRERIEVPMRDGTNLYVEVVRPEGDGRFPVVMEASPYHGTIADRDGTRIFPDPKDPEGNKVGLTGYFAPRGYAVVMVDLRGTGRSEGCLDHLGPNDASDLKEIVEWAARQDWSSGRVGMTGHSYVGSTPSVAAAQRPEGLVTIAPSAGLASMYDHQFQFGVPWWLQYVGPMVAYELLALDRHLPPGAGLLSDGGDNFGNDPEDTGCGMKTSALTAGSGQVTGQYEQWHRERDSRAGAAAADLPIFMIHGVNDNAARIPAAEWFFKTRYERASGKGRKGRGAPVFKDDKVWLGQWDHGSPGATRCSAGHPNCRFEQWQFALHAWFDRHLQQRDVDTGPQVEVFLNEDKVVTDDRWKPSADPLTLHADGSGALSAGGAGQAGSTSFRGAPTWTSGTFVDFTSAPATESTTFVGQPQLRLEAATTGPVQLVATLYEKSADGKLDLLNPVTVCAIQPLLRAGVDTVTPIVPGQRMSLDPQCFTAAHTLDAGESLVLRVSAAHRQRGSHHAPTLAGDPQVTLFTGEDGTAITVPRVTDAVLHDDVLAER